KIYPIITEARKYQNWIDLILISTAQHREMLDQIASLFQVVPGYDLDIMKHNQTISQINSQTLLKLERIYKETKPDIVLVQGDTTTTFSGALAAFYQKINIGHIEAGLRTTKKYYPFPEEINRRLTTVLTDYHFAPTENAKKLLLKEGIDKNNIYVTGNTVIDTLFLMQKKDITFSDHKINNIILNKNQRILLVTMHRRENWGKPLEDLCRSLLCINEKYDNVKIIFPVHKNPLIKAVVNKYLSGKKDIVLSDPLDYSEMANLIKYSTLILTDSGGIQEEAPALGKPVLILRNETERIEVIEKGFAKLIGTEPDKIINNVENLLSNDIEYKKMSCNKRSPYGDGKAANRIIEFILFKYNYISEKPDEFII
ncbi:MAG: UDP-N-acetylglucosamine 2-epimerase (non-hydrolyzing), partial [Atribacterota bacterium]|nr:UDP-N-acetylglucosamine 2-epimerase (non-hydrolyzing) [Atribacterota bacterium]